ncbi:type II/IV secretion system protein [Oleiharenicola lentus]|uniref:Type II/IV secretion system protein n=2 Tax=Oleiharenicola lentus TaxID=2508720 RepID=A0A4Q1CD38_9BACT|nr:type II/IV secretion system protein [Oleiharenicola lentus]
MLPAALRTRLSEDQRRTLAESPRDRRLTALATALGGDEPIALDALATATGLPVQRDLKPDPEGIPLLPARLTRDFLIVPILAAEPNGVLTLATTWPADDVVRDWLATFTQRPLRWVLAPTDRINQLIVECYGVGAGSLENDDDLPELAVNSLASDNEADEEAAVVRFVTEVISQAIEDGATDIHFEPQEGQLRIRYRVDGLLVPVPLPENLIRYQDAIISRLKIMARLNISEKRLPQDGRINFRAAGNTLDIRVSTIPTIYAESVSLRLLNLRREAYTMDRLGMDAGEQAAVRRVLGFPHGIILVTGPTGSGKSTSLNAFLREINSTDLRIVTVEDPIEYEVPGANQIQVRPEIGLTFASALRHILRQDPDVIMVGEVRDRETADIAIRASLTGHLVFSTLHTNDAPGAITRLTDMGIEPFLITSAVELVIAQRLVRRLCEHCAKPTPVDLTKLRDSLSILGLDHAEADGVNQLLAPVGCDRCRQTGFRGRVGLFEILEPVPELHDLVIKRESTRTLAKCAREHGMRTLQQSGWQKVRSGLTTIDEVLRVITVSDH